MSIDVQGLIDSLEIKRVDVDSLIPYARNSKTHSAEQVALIASHMQEVGWTNPILIDGKNGIIAGHGRLEAARKLKLARVPVIELSHLSEAQKRALVIWDNRSTEFGTTWNLEMLKIELDDLAEIGFDIGSIGFDEDALADFFPDIDTSGNGKDPDAAPDVPEVPHSKPGDVWVCGPHKITCGDSTNPETWERLMGTELGDLVMTDPPFGVSYAAKGKKAIANDDLTGDKLKDFLKLVNANLFQRLKPGSSVYMFHADSEGLAFRQSLIEVGFKVSQCLTWVKDSLVLGRSRYQWRHEPCLLADRPGGKQRWWGGRKQTTVVDYGGEPFEQLEDGRWAIRNGDELLIVDGSAKVEAAPGSIVRHPKPKRSEHHPTQKPVAMLTRLMQNSARSNDIVIEPFSGSGSTLMASELLGMCCRASELDPGYVDVAVMRWQAYSGRSAVHAETGEEFPVPPSDCMTF